MVFPRRSPRSPRSRYTLGLLVLTAITLLVLDLPGTGPLQPVRNVLAGAFRPIRSAGDTVFAPISNGWKGAFGYDEVSEENDRLRAELEDAKADEAELARLEVENRALKEQQQVKMVGVSLKTAKVVSGALSSFDETVEIDVGSGDGIKDGMAVVSGMAEDSGGALLGRVEKISGGRSKVQLLTSPDFVAGVRVKGALGILRGQGRGRPLLIEQIPASVKLKKGTFVYTAGIEDSPFPEDVAVGRVRSVDVSTDRQTQSVEVDPLVDLASVYVKVVLKDPPR